MVKIFEDDKGLFVKHKQTKFYAYYYSDDEELMDAWKVLLQRGYYGAYNIYDITWNEGLSDESKMAVLIDAVSNCAGFDFDNSLQESIENLL